MTQLHRQEQQRAAFFERHAPEATQYLAVVRELAWRQHAQARILELEEPGYLVNALGHVPKTSRSRRTWRSAAIEVDGYRHMYGITDPDHTLGLEPQGDLMRRNAWRSCREAIDHHLRDERQGYAVAEADHEERQRGLT